MILEALKRLSGSSVFGNSSSSSSNSTQNRRHSKYGFTTRPMTDYNTDIFDATTSSSEPHLLPVEEDDSEHFKVSHLVKFLGSGVVSHHTDFGGCQEVMDSLKQPRRKKKRYKSTALIITFTSSAMITTSAGFQRRKHVCNLENIFVVHPHPTKEKWFGFISNHTSSGTLKCFCYMTLDNSTGTDVLLSFREACNIWISDKQRRDESEVEWREQYRSDSTIQDGQCTSGLLSESQSQCTSRKVSFAPTLNVFEDSDTLSAEIDGANSKEKFKDCIVELECSPFFVGTTRNLPSSSYNLDESDASDESEEVLLPSVYYSRPQLPPKAYPPPLPPTSHQQFFELVLPQDDIESDTSSESDVSVSPGRQTPHKLVTTTSDGHYTDYGELNEYDFIKEETLFRNFGRSFSAPCLSCYSEQPELFAKYSQILYRHSDTSNHDVRCCNSTTTSSSSSTEAIIFIDDEGDDVGHTTRDSMSLSLSNTDLDVDDCDSVESEASSVTLGQDRCAGASGSGDMTTITADLIQEGGCTHTKSSTVIIESKGVDNQLSVISISQSWMSSDTDSSTSLNEDNIASFPPFISHLTNACTQLLSNFNTSSILSAIIQHTTQQGRKISHPVMSKLVSHDITQLANLAPYLVRNKYIQSKSLSSNLLSVQDEMKAEMEEIQQALGQNDSSTVLVMKTSESLNQCVPVNPDSSKSNDGLSSRNDSSTSGESSHLEDCVSNEDVEESKEEEPNEEVEETVTDNNTRYQVV